MVDGHVQCCQCAMHGCSNTKGRGGRKEEGKGFAGRMSNTSYACECAWHDALQ